MTENCFIPVENEQIAILMKLLGHTDYVCLSVSQGGGCWGYVGGDFVQGMHFSQ